MAASRSRSLGAAPFPVSPLALGCWTFAGGAQWGRADERESIATIHAALDLGITLLDTAPGYGDGASEEIVGRALADRRDQALIATKVGGSDLTAAGVRASCEASLRRLRTDRVDLLQIHWAEDQERLPEAIAAFEQLQVEGKARACGVCNFGPRQLDELHAHTTTAWAAHQLPYNLLWRAIEFDLMAPTRHAGLGILAYSPLQQGLLSGRFRHADEVPPGRARSRHFRGDRPGSRHGESGQEEETFAALARVMVISERLGRAPAQVALAWLLAQPGVSSLLVGARTPAQMHENAAALDLTLDPATLRELATATDELKRLLGPNPDMWAATSRYR